MGKKVTIMVLKVDLECCKCYKKVKKVLCKFPQIRDQIYDENQNIVTIKVVCCSPEKIRDKISCNGGGSIKSIEIKSSSPEDDDDEKPEVPERNKEQEPERDGEPEPEPTVAVPIAWLVDPFCGSYRECCEEQCHPVGCAPPYYYYDGYYGIPVYDGCGGDGDGCSRGYYRCRSDDNCREENPYACTIM